MIRLFLMLVICAKVINTARILGVFPVPCRSHQLVFQRLMEELLTRGHELVVLSADGAIYNKHPNLTIIDAHNVSYNMFQSTYNFATSQKQSSSQIMMNMKSKVALGIDADFSLSQMQAIFSNKSEHFDLIFAEMLNRFLTLLSVRFHTPLIGITSFTAPASSFDAVGNPTNPLFYTDNSADYLASNNLWTNINNLYSFMFNTYIESYIKTIQNRVTMKHFGRSVPSTSEAGENMEVLLLNINPIFAGIRPAVPALHYLGGLHLGPRKELPKALAAFMDNSKQGVIYLSFGSNVMLSALPWSKIEIFLHVFRELPFNFILKWENDTLPGKPTNVFTSKWLPQQDLLGHSYMKAFVSQCGQQSTDETVHNGVPVLCVPFLLDQFVNSQRVEKFGIGRSYDFKLLDKVSFEVSLLDVAENKKYRENIKRFSALLQDQKWTSLERAVWWTEYVLRHKGAPHLKASVIPLYEYLIIDVIIIMIMLLLVVVYLTYVTVRLLKSSIRNIFYVIRKEEEDERDCEVLYK